MKTRYILECYDNIIREIQRPKLFSEESLVQRIQTISAESYLVYPVIYLSEHNPSYELGAPIHNLHFNAYQIANYKTEVDSADFIYEIATTLKVGPEEIKYFRYQEIGFQRDYITVEVPLESLAPNALLFIYSFQKLIRENDVILKKYRDNVYRLKSRRMIEHFINTQHKAIGNICNQLLKQMKAEDSENLHAFSADDSYADSLKVVYACLDKLVRTIESEFKTYIDKGLYIPCLSGLIPFNRSAQIDLNKIQFLTRIDDRLQITARNPITKIQRLKSVTLITYNEFYYCDLYGAAVLRFLAKLPTRMTEEELIDNLLEYNLNDLALFDYLTDKIESKLQLIEDATGKLKILYSELKIYNQYPTIRFARFYENLPDIKAQIVCWIEEEIEYHQRTMKLELPLTVQNGNVTKSKLESGISVAQLSYTFSLLSQVGVISQKNQRDIFRFIADNFKTSMTDQISVDSIKSKYYNVESSTKAAVREKMIAILNLTKL